MPVFTQVGEELYVDTLLANLAFYVGWGTGTTAENKADTVLETPAAEARVLATEQDNGDDFDLVATIVSASSQTIAEVGVFNTSTSGTLIIRDAFTGVLLGIGDGIEFTINQELA